MKYYKFDVITATLTISSAFEAALLNRESEEYRLYQQLHEDFPNLKMIRRTHATPKAYRTKSGEKFKNNPMCGLSYAAMECFLEALPNTEPYKREYEKAKKLAKSCNVRPYTMARIWFLTQFPNYRTDVLQALHEPPELIEAGSLSVSHAA